MHWILILSVALSSASATPILPPQSSTFAPGKSGALPMYDDMSGPIGGSPFAPRSEPFSDYGVQEESFRSSSPMFSQGLNSVEPPFSSGYDGMAMDTENTGGPGTLRPLTEEELRIVEPAVDKWKSETKKDSKRGGGKGGNNGGSKVEKNRGGKEGNSRKKKSGSQKAPGGGSPGGTPRGGM